MVWGAYMSLIKHIKKLDFDRSWESHLVARLTRVVSLYVVEVNKLQKLPTKLQQITSSSKVAFQHTMWRNRPSVLALAWETEVVAKLIKQAVERNFFLCKVLIRSFLQLNIILGVFGWCDCVENS